MNSKSLPDFGGSDVCSNEEEDEHQPVVFDHKACFSASKMPADDINTMSLPVEVQGPEEQAREGNRMLTADQFPTHELSKEDRRSVVGCLRDGPRSPNEPKSPNIKNVTIRNRLSLVTGGPLYNAGIPLGPNWRDELQALKDDLALPESVCIRIGEMVKSEATTTENLQSEEEGQVPKETEKIVADNDFSVVLKDIDLDFLSTFGSGKIDKDLVRQSVMVRFDPVVEKALNEPSPARDQSEMQKTDVTDIKAEESGLNTKLTAGQPVEESVRRISAVPMQIMKNRKQDVKELNELIEKLTLEIEEEEKKPRSYGILSTSEQTELLMKLNADIPALQEELNEPPHETERILKEMEERDRDIAQLGEDIEKFEANEVKDLELKTQDYNAHTEHLEYMEELFDKIYENYKKAKEAKKGLIHNKTVLEEQNRLLSEGESQLKEYLTKIKSDHETAITNAKRELTAKEAEIRALSKQPPNHY